MNNTLEQIENLTFTCSACGRIIYPEITYIDSTKETLILESYQNSLCGGKGNKVLADNICNNCTKEATMFAKTMTELKMG